MQQSLGQLHILLVLSNNSDPFDCNSATKGQLISKGLFGVIVSIKKATKFVLRIFALAYEKSSNKKTLWYNYVN